MPFIDNYSFDSPVPIIRQLVKLSIRNGATRIRIGIDSTSIGSITITDDGHGISQSLIGFIREKIEKKNARDKLKISLSEMNQIKSSIAENLIQTNSSDATNLLFSDQRFFRDLFDLCQEITIKRRRNSHKFIERELHSVQEIKNEFPRKCFPLEFETVIRLRGLFCRQIGRKRILLSNSRQTINDIHRLICTMRSRNAGINFEFHLTNCEAKIVSLSLSTERFREMIERPIVHQKENGTISTVISGSGR